MKRTAGKPTVCIVSPNRDAYSETFIQAHIERLPAEVRVLYGNPPPPSWDEGRPLLPQGLPYRLARAAACRIFGTSQDLFRTRALRHFFLERRIDVVLAEYGPTGVGVLDACRQTQTPLVVHFHGFDAYNERVLGAVGARYPELFEYASALVAVSHDMETQLSRLGAPPEKVQYNPYGVDVDLFKGGDPAHAPPIFVAVGRFVDKKAPHLTLAAFGNVVQTVPKARLVMIGDGPLWEACKQLARGLGIEDVVEFLGMHPHPEVAVTMQQARCFVQHSITTSYGEAEGTPVAIIEAGATGLPVVATKHGGIPDVVIDGKTGLLVGEGELGRMAACMTQIAEHPRLAGRLGRAARQRIHAEFSVDKSIASLWHIIEAQL